MIQGAFEYSAISSGGEGLSLGFLTGAGGTTTNTDDFSPRSHPVTGEIVTDFQRTYPTLTAGARLGCDVGTRVALAFGWRAYIAFARERDTAILSDITSSDVEPFRAILNLPLSLGVALRL